MRRQKADPFSKSDPLFVLPALMLVAWSVLFLGLYLVLDEQNSARPLILLLLIVPLMLGVPTLLIIQLLAMFQRR